jgi:hypothetical protein
VSPRIAANSADIVLNAFTLAAWGSVSSPRGLMHSAAASIGETNCPVVESLRNARRCCGCVDDHRVAAMTPLGQQALQLR